MEVSLLSNAYLMLLKMMMEIMEWEIPFPMSGAGKNLV
jgi:hypothetical protein